MAEQSERMIGNLRGLLRTMRPRQWTKNLVIYAALVFDGKLFNWPLLWLTTLVVIAFCLISSAVYIVNDIADIEKDRLHPRKSKRPLPAGQLAPGFAWVGALVIAAAGLALSFWVNPWVGVVGVVYLGQNLLYSFWLKNVVIIDVMVLALGFLLRVVAGAIVADVRNFSPWLYVCITLLALFLGFGKRRQEIALLEGDASSHRASLADYNLSLLDQIISLVTTSTFIAYTLYCIEATTLLVKDGRMLLTAPFVFYVIARYLFLIHVRKQGGAPDELIFQDKGLFFGSIAWALLVVVLLYFR